MVAKLVGCMKLLNYPCSDPNMIPLITIKMSLCQRCVTSQSAIQVWGSLIRRQQFSTTYVPFNIRNSVSKQVKSDSSASFGEKAKEATRTTSYTAVVLVGVGVTGLMLYSVFKELLSSFSPQSVYSAAVEKCIANSRIVDLLGDSVKSYGEESRRGRRQHISHLPYEVNGAKGLRIKFYLQGQRRTATAHLDARETSSGWEFRYLFVQLDAYPYEVIVVEDNRGKSCEPGAVFPGQADIPTLTPESNSGVGLLTPIFPSK